MADLTTKSETFVILARSTKGAATAQVILDATAAAGVYAFAELLDLTNIKDLENDPSFARHHALLRLFAYGNLRQYIGNEDSYPPIQSNHILKLKHLTLVSLASQHRSLPYSVLLPELQLESTRQLEDLIIDVIYSGLLGGKMHHHRQVLHVDWVAGRDVDSQSLSEIQKKLQNWCTTAENLLESLDNQIRVVRQDAAEEAQALKEYKGYRDAEYAVITAELRQNATSGHGRAAGNKKGGSVGDDPFESRVISAGGAFVTKGTPSKGGRNLTRNISSPDELSASRKPKRTKD